MAGVPILPAMLITLSSCFSPTCSSVIKPRLFPVKATKDFLNLLHECILFSFSGEEKERSFSKSSPIFQLEQDEAITIGLSHLPISVICEIIPGLTLLFGCLEAFVFFKAIGRIWNACLVVACFNFSFLPFFNFFVWCPLLSPQDCRF